MEAENKRRLQWQKRRRNRRIWIGLGQQRMWLVDAGDRQQSMANACKTEGEREACM